MGKKSRRSISVRGLTYQRIQAHCDANGGQSISGFIEDLIRDKIGGPSSEECRKFAEEAKMREMEEEPAPANHAEILEIEKERFDRDYTSPIQKF